MKIFHRFGLVILGFLIISACADRPDFTASVLPPTATSTQPATATPVPTETSTTNISIRQTAVEVITSEGATGDGGNIWGGHQTRIVHTAEGIFTAYTTGTDYFNRIWHLVKRRAANDWYELAQGNAGREPVNLLASPDGTLHIVGWPEGRGTLWSGRPQGEALTLTSQLIPDMPEGYWPYNSAGISANGTLCVLASLGGEEAGGEFRWACLLPSTGKWISQTTALDYRYCYTYVFPGSNGQLSLVSTRDVRWEALGYTKPTGAFDYVFNALGFWQTENLSETPPALRSFAEEIPSDSFPNPMLNAQMDAYLDTNGNMHILYWHEGQSTGGTQRSMHRIVSPDGRILFEGQLPDGPGYFDRIFQDGRKNFYLLNSSGLLYPMDEKGEKVLEPIQLDLGGYEIEYSGHALSVPRTGTLPGNTMDVVFPSGNETQWIYFQITFGD